MRPPAAVPAPAGAAPARRGRDFLWASSGVVVRAARVRLHPGFLTPPGQFGCNAVCVPQLDGFPWSKKLISRVETSVTLM